MASHLRFSGLLLSSHLQNLVYCVSAYSRFFSYWIVEKDEYLDKWGDSSTAWEFSFHGYVVRGRLSDLAAFGPKTSIGKLITIALAFAVLMVLACYNTQLAASLAARYGLVVNGIEDIIEANGSVCTWHSKIPMLQRLYPGLSIRATADYWAGIPEELDLGLCHGYIGPETDATFQILHARTGPVRHHCNKELVGGIIAPVHAVMYMNPRFKRAALSLGWLMMTHETGDAEFQQRDFISTVLATGRPCIRQEVEMATRHASARDGKAGEDDEADIRSQVDLRPLVGSICIFAVCSLIVWAMFLGAGGY